ncbi:MAG: UDP-3-O-(3-hydroxymyristoyl)glucosamine N-acyltransferase [Candidatus Margulisiibacteriota bacterium]
MPFSLEQIAKLCQGEIAGDAKTKISGVAAYAEASPGDLTFLLEDKFSKLPTDASAVVVRKDTKLESLACYNKTISFLLVNNPRLALAQSLTLFEKKLSLNKGVHKTAVVGKGTKIGEGAAVGANVVIGENVKISDGVKIFSGAFVGDQSEIGKNSIIFPNAVIYHGVIIGKNVIIHAGAAIGVDGFGFVPGPDGYTKIPQVGGVIIEDDVEVFANTTIARATLGNTIIKKGTKIDCLVHIAHNCVLGKHCALAAQVGLSGSVTFEARVTAAGQAGFKDHVTIGENTVVLARAGVTKNIPNNQVVSGFPAVPHTEDLDLQAHLHRLPKLFKKIAEMEK